MKPIVSLLAGSQPISSGGTRPSQVLNWIVLGQAKVLRGKKACLLLVGHEFLIQLGTVSKPTLKWVVKKWAGSSSFLDKVLRAGLVFVCAGVSSGKLSGPSLALPQRHEVDGVLWKTLVVFEGKVAEIALVGDSVYNVILSHCVATSPLVPNPYFCQ